MKKTLLFLCIGLLLTSSNLIAQHTFATDTNVYTVPDDVTVVPVSINDAANSAAAPGGTYLTFQVTADWSITGGNAWSSEEALTVTTAAGSVTIDPPTSGGASNTDPTTLTFDGTLAGPYDPTVDGTLDLGL